MGCVRSRFLRAVVEVVRHESQGLALARLREGLSPHQARLLEREVLAPLERDARVELDAALDLLLGIDRVLCGGSGATTTRVATAFASRVLSQSAGLVVPGDALATLQHLRAAFEQPFIDTELRFAARRTFAGFVLELHLPGEPRAARWLASAGLGYAKAAARFSGEAGTRLHLLSELGGDVARVLARHADTGVVSIQPSMTPSSAPSSSREERARLARRRPSTTNAAARVDQILSRATPRPGLTALDPTLRGTRASSRPPAPLAKALPHESGTRPAVDAALAAKQARKIGF
jgi:hypothetical protein